MSRRVILGIWIAAFCGAALVHADDHAVETCRRESVGTAWNTQISACSEIINSTQWLPEARAAAFNSRGRVYSRRMRDLDTAIADFDRAIEIKPDFAEAFQNRGNAWLNKGDFARAIGDFDSAVALKPRMPLLLGDRGYALMTNGDHDRALKDFDRIAVQHSEDDKAFAYRCWARLHGGKPDLAGALSDCTQSLNFSGGAKAHAARGLVQWRRGKVREAFLDFSSALKQDPELAMALHMRGVARAALGDAASAGDRAEAKGLLPPIEKIAALCGEPAPCPAAPALGDRDAVWCNGGPNIRVDLQISGCTAIVRGQHAQGAALARVLNKRSRALLSINARAEALSDVNQAILLNPAYAVAFVTRGYISYYRGRYKEAIPDYDEAIRMSPDAAAYFYRGLAKRGSNDHDGAAADFERAVQLDPDYREALMARGGSHAVRGDYRAAIRDYDRVLSLDPTAAGALNARGEAYLKLGDKARALRDLEHAVRLNPAFGEARD